MARRLRSLSGLDALFLYLEAAGTPMHVASLLRLQPPPRQRDYAAVVVEHLKARLGDLPLLRRRLEDAPFALGHPMWREGGELAIDQHVQLRRLPKPGSASQLATLVARLHAKPLRRDRPLWEIVVIDGLDDGDVAVYLRAHHALLDGQAGVRVMQRIVDVAPLLPESRRRGAATDAAPAAADLRTRQVARAALRASAGQFGRMLRGLPAGWRQLRRQAEGGDLLGRLRDSVWLAPRTPFNVNLGSGRRLALCSLPIAAVKRVARHFGGSLNDVVMALVADAARSYLQRRRALPDKPLIAAMPVSLREGDSELGNEVSMVQCPLATDIADPVERLQAIIQATRAIKGRVHAFRGLIPTDFPGIAAPIWATGLSRLWQRGRLAERLPALANLVVSNVPGPPVPLYLAAGRIRHYHPVSIVTHGLGLNITLVSYDGQLEVGVVSARESLDRPALFAAGMELALQKLLAELPE